MNSTILSCYPILIPVVKRKPILLVDKSDDSTKAIDLFKRSGIEYVEYDIRKFEYSCCGELPRTKAPSVFAVEGVFKGLEKINEHISLKRKSSDSKIESECILVTIYELPMASFVGHCHKKPTVPGILEHTIPTNDGR